MTQENNATTQPNQPASVATPILIGAGVGLTLIALFLFGTGKPNPEWGTLWMIKPLVMVPLAGAMGGLFYYFLAHLSSQGKLNKTVALIVSLAVYIIALWLGAVLGLNGTMWD